MHHHVQLNRIKPVDLIFSLKKYRGWKSKLKTHHKEIFRQIKNMRHYTEQLTKSL